MKASHKPMVLGTRGTALKKKQVSIPTLLKLSFWCRRQTTSKINTCPGYKAL